MSTPINTNGSSTEAAQSDRAFFGHPRGLSTLFFTEMWERFSYYGIRPLLVIFMSTAIMSGGFGIPRSQASAIVGIYAASVYLASLPGGWVADRLLGLRRAIMTGAVLISCGHISISLSSLAHTRVTFFVGLILIVLGTGLLKPNISAIVGDLYPEGGARRDAGFSIFYMGINTGAFLGQLVTGFLGEKIGWHFGFGAAGVGMLIGLAWFAARSKKTLGDLGLQPSRHPNPAVQRRQELIIKLAVAIGLGVLAVVVVLAALGVFHINPQGVGHYMTYVLVGVAVLYFGALFIFGGLTSDEMKRVGVIFILFVFAAIFWAAFEQAPTSLNLFAKDFTNRRIMRPSGTPSSSAVHRAVDQALDWTKTGGTVRVIGVQELSGENAARADIEFDNFQFNSDQTGKPIPKTQTAPGQPNPKDPNFYGEVSKFGTQQVRISTYSGRGVAIIKHYTDGRWVLTNVQWNFITINSDVEVGGWEIPATWFQSVNSAFIILLAPFFAALWLRMGQRGSDLSSPAKFSLGLLFAGVGFAIMIFAANIVVRSGGLIKVSFLWLTVSYFFQTVGELCLSPVGLSSMTKLSPRKYVGQMMGIWFLASALGNLIAGLVGGNVDPEKLDQMPKLFIVTTISLVAAGLLLAAMTPLIKKFLPNKAS